MPPKVVSQSNPELATKMFTTLAMISPINANTAKRPTTERSRLVTAPNTERPANAPAVMKNVFAIDPEVYTRNNIESVKPGTAAYAKNIAAAAMVPTRGAATLNATTKPICASITVKNTMRFWTKSSTAPGECATSQATS